jgi:hypothetical protein
LLAMLLVSPLGIAAVAVLAILGALCLWLAYLLGRRGGQPKQNPPVIVSSLKSVPDEFTLQSKDEVSPTKS